MNKARRHELKMLHYKRRVLLYGFKKDLLLSNISSHNLYSFRSHGSPCSCYMCSPNKYSRAKEKVKLKNILNDTH